MKPSQIAKGQRFGSLVTVELRGSPGSNNPIWRCACDCGAIVRRGGLGLIRGAKKKAGPCCKACRKARANKPMLQPGDVFGSLTVVELQGKRGAHRLWLCECDCGRPALRTTGDLMSSKKLGQQPCCQRCVDELRRGFALDKADRYRAASADSIRRCFETTGLLYWDMCSMDTARLAVDAIWNDLEAVGIERPEQDVALPLLVEKPRLKQHDGNSRQQRFLDLYPFNGGKKLLWRCFHCGHFRPDVFGCPICLEVVCIKCAKHWLHAHNWSASGEPMTREKREIIMRLAAHRSVSQREARERG